MPKVSEKESGENALTFKVKRRVFNINQKNPKNVTSMTQLSYFNYHNMITFSKELILK